MRTFVTSNRKKPQINTISVNLWFRLRSKTIAWLLSYSSRRYGRCRNIDLYLGNHEFQIFEVDILGITAKLFHFPFQAAIVAAEIFVLPPHLIVITPFLSPLDTAEVW